MPDIFVIVSSYETLSSDPSKCRVEGRSSAAGRTVGDIGSGSDKKVLLCAAT